MIDRSDPRRRSLPLPEWPAGDQAAWIKARTPVGLFEEGGHAAHWADATQRTNEKHYGRWLSYLQQVGELDPEALPADRVTRDHVRAYNQHLVELGVAPRTRLSTLVGLKVMMQTMAPDRPWRWLQDACNRVQIQAKPQKDKRSRMRPSPEIFQAALAELERLGPEPLSLKDTILYRDALMLAFLAMRPLRVKNFTALTLGHHLVRTETDWLVSVPARETKNKRPSTFDLPDDLLPWLERYLSEVRLSFPGAQTSQRLWLGKDGPLGNVVGSRVKKLTLRLFGRSINPHLLRDCGASSLANSDGKSAVMAAALLGHGHPSTTEQYYIQADNLAASRRVGSLLDGIKTQLERK